ncbi:MAG: hypothetical protein DDT25_00605 [Chloroflexi bacterium]|nr:hypothetical protein [Chloroflexota bacterium]
MLSIRDRLAHLTSNPTALSSLEIINNSQPHTSAHEKYLREMRLIHKIPENANASECFTSLAEMAGDFDKKLEAANCFQKPAKPHVTTRHEAEAAMTHSHRTCLGNISQDEHNLLIIRNISGLANLLDGACKARKLIALTRYFAGDYMNSPLQSEQIAHQAISILMPYINDYYADLLVIDRDSIVGILDVSKKNRMWIWVKDNGTGTWMEQNIANVPNTARVVIEVSNKGVKQLLRAPQMELSKRATPKVGRTISP